ncbi:hypothetical protein [Ruegeria lacuscaerulensis]|uniref:hypothetical protein n=1 Tax=Ruegeria lacuscaerulensis TaxID=55218 RepID=UPI00147D7B03|nr:hypothetical protein [Ruegeria lacuscaerulensis]
MYDTGSSGDDLYTLGCKGPRVFRDVRVNMQNFPIHHEGNDFDVLVRMETKYPTVSYCYARADAFALWDGYIAEMTA